MKFIALIKDVNVKTLVSGDKSARLVLETLYPEDCRKFARASKWLEVTVEIKENK